MTGLSRQTWWVVAIAAAAGLLLSLVVVLTDNQPGRVQQVRGSAAVSGSPSTDNDATARGDRRRSPDSAGTGPAVERNDASLSSREVLHPRPPLRVRVPDLGLDAQVRAVGVSEDRQMRLPADPRVLGWYRFGPAPGDGGSVVLAGHVDSRRFGVGPLATLQTIERGSLIEVVTGPDEVRAYRVDSIERFDRQALPEGVFARTGTERLRLVTCTGPYLPEAGGYQENLVVTAVPI